MTRGMHTTLSVMIYFYCLLVTANAADDSTQPKVAVVVGPNAGELERFAADQLCEYLDKLYKIKVRPGSEIPGFAEIILLVGSPETNPAIREAVATETWPKLSDQGLVLKRFKASGKEVLIIGGGSPRATLWAVYELVEGWGVRYLLHGDVLPAKPGRLQLPAKDVVLEPSLRIRQWRVVNEHAMGPVSWGLADYRPLLDQLAKLKFNRIFAYIWPLQPFVDFEAGGIRRKSATIFFGLRFPITDDMPGRRLFGSQSEFWNPDLPIKAGYQDMMAAGQRHLHGLFDHARKRGMDCGTVANLGEFPPEFAPLLKNAQKTIGVGAETLVPGKDTEVTDPGLTQLAAAVLQATVNTYPEADFVEIGMQEHRQWADKYEQSWRALDARYGIDKVRPLSEVLSAAGRRTGYPGGAARALQEVKGDIVALHFYDRLLHEKKALAKSRRPKVRLLYDSIAEELFPVLGKIVPPGSETLNFVDYTASRVVKRREVLKNIPSRDVPSILIFTLHDDNVGILPQLATDSLHELIQDLRKNGWAGFSTRYWLVGDHEPCAAYLARACWDAKATPEASYRDQIRAICGDACVEDMLTVFHEVEKVTRTLEWHGLGLTFPVPGMFQKEWTPHALSAEILGCGDGYQKALTAAQRARDKSEAHGRGYVEYWIARLEFGIGYLNMVDMIRQAAQAEAQKKPVLALAHAEKALATLRQALETFAQVARDPSDRGTIAVLGELVYRPLKHQVARLK